MSTEARRLFSSLLLGLALTLAALAQGGEGSLPAGSADRIKRAQSQADLEREIDALGGREEYGAMPTTGNWRTDRDNFSQLLEHLEEKQKAAAEPPAPTVPDASARAREIVDSPVYSDAGPTQKRESASGSFGRLLQDLIDRLSIPFTGGSVGGFAALGYVIFGLAVIAGFALLVAIVYGLYLLFQSIVIRKRSKRLKSSRLADEDGLMTTDERMLSADEWLAKADDLTAQGKYREAVRCLYLASLVRFDEHRVASFDRGQTNWEHLTRIMDSPVRPRDIDFRPLTRLFDRVWYGMECRGAEDVETFREGYQTIYARLKEKRNAS